MVPLVGSEQNYQRDPEGKSHSFKSSLVFISESSCLYISMVKFQRVKVGLFIGPTHPAIFTWIPFAEHVGCGLKWEDTFFEARNWWDSWRNCAVDSFWSMINITGVHPQTNGSMIIWLVVQAVPILKNHGLRQWEGWHPIYEMENKTCLKPPTSHILLAYRLRIHTFPLLSSEVTPHESTIVLCEICRTAHDHWQTTCAKENKSCLLESFQIERINCPHYILEVSHHRPNPILGSLG